MGMARSVGYTHPRITSCKALTRLPETTEPPRGGKGQGVPVPEPPQPSLPRAVRSKAPAPDGCGGPGKGGDNCKVGLWLPKSGMQALGVLAESREGSPGSHPAVSRHLPEVPVPGNGGFGGPRAGRRGCAVAVAAGLLAPGCSGTRRDVSET